MLIELYGKNFACFRDEFRLSMLATDVDRNSDRGIVKVKLAGEDEPLRLLRAVGIYGPNGSGKSTVLRAAQTLGNLISENWIRRFRSDSVLEPYEPFALGKENSHPVQLGIKAVIDGHIYDYEIRFERTRFVSERLHRLDANKEIILFNRDGQAVTGDWATHEQFTLLSKDFRPNAPLLALADRFAPALARNIAVSIRDLLERFPAPVGIVSLWGPEDTRIANRVSDDAEFGAFLIGQLKFADVGIVDLKSIEMSLQPGKTQEKDLKLHRLELLHRATDGSVPLPYEGESDGTKKLIELAPMIYDLTHSGKPHAVFADEIDESLHPVLLAGLIRHFNCPIPADKVRGQLIFVTHDTTLIDQEAKNAVLRRDQIYLTEKDSSGAARLYSVAEFKERNNLNLRRRYLQGRYGALPALGTLTE